MLFNAISLAKNRFYIFLVKHNQHKYFTNRTLYPRRIFHHSASLFDCSESQCWPICIFFPAHNIMRFWLRFLLSFCFFINLLLLANKCLHWIENEELCARIIRKTSWNVRCTRYNSKWCLLTRKLWCDALRERYRHYSHTHTITWRHKALHITRERNAVAFGEQMCEKYSGEEFCDAGECGRRTQQRQHGIQSQ